MSLACQHFRNSTELAVFLQNNPHIHLHPGARIEFTDDAPSDLQAAARHDEPGYVSQTLSTLGEFAASRGECTITHPGVVPVRTSQGWSHAGVNGGEVYTNSQPRRGLDGATYPDLSSLVSGHDLPMSEAEFSQLLADNGIDDVTQRLAYKSDALLAGYLSPHATRRATPLQKTDERTMQATARQPISSELAHLLQRAHVAAGTTLSTQGADWIIASHMPNADTATRMGLKLQMQERGILADTPGARSTRTPQRTMSASARIARKLDSLIGDLEALVASKRAGTIAHMRASDSAGQCAYDATSFVC